MFAPKTDHGISFSDDSRDTVNSMSNSKPTSTFKAARIALLALAAALACLALTAAEGKAAEFGIQPGSFDPQLTGPDATQAGAAANLEFGFKMNVVDPATPRQVVGSIKDLHVDLPKGMVANPTHFVECSLPEVDLFPTPCP